MFHHSAQADDFQRDLMSQRVLSLATDSCQDTSIFQRFAEAMTFENDAMPGAQFFVNEQEDSACTEASCHFEKRWSAIESKRIDISFCLGTIWDM